MEEYSIRIGDYDFNIGGYKYLCMNIKCKQIFYGRKNRKYCCGRCKNMVNNEKKNMLRKGMSRDMKQYEKNQKILEKLHINNPTTVNISTLFRDGFDGEAPKRDVKYLHFEGKWNAYGSYSIQTKENKALIIKNK